MKEIIETLQTVGLFPVLIGLFSLLVVGIFVYFVFRHPAEKGVRRRFKWSVEFEEE